MRTERFRRGQHRFVGLVVGLLILAVLKEQLRFKRGTLGIAETEVGGADHLTGALAHAHVADAVCPRVAPIGVERRVLRVRRNRRQILDASPSAPSCPTRLHQSWNTSSPCRSATNRSVMRVDDIRDRLRRDRPDRQAVEAAVLQPLAAEHHLEVGDGVPVDIAAISVETQVRNVVLAATVEAPADLDPQAADRSRPAPCSWRPGARAARRPSPREEAMPSLQVSVPGQAVTSTIVPAPARSRPTCLELRVERGNIRFADPAEHQVLLDGQPHVPAGVPVGEMRERPHLVGRQIAQRAGDGDDGVTLLPLRVDVGLGPLRRNLRAWPRRSDASAASPVLRGTRGSRRNISATTGLPASCGVLPRPPCGTPRCPAWRRRTSAAPSGGSSSRRAWRTRGRSPAPTGIISSSGQNSISTFAWCGTAPSPPPTNSLKPRWSLPSTMRVAAMPPRSCMRHQGAGLVLAAGERDLELAAEILRVRMAEQVIRARPWRTG